MLLTTASLGYSQQDPALAVGAAPGRTDPLSDLESHEGRWRLQFDFDPAAWQRLLDHRLGRTVLLTNRMDWTAEQVALGYSAQQDVERVFRGLKDRDWLGWGPMHHWTDRKIRIHAFYCMLGISLLQYIHKQAQAAWNGISMEQLLEELRQIQQFVLLYPPQGEKGPNRVATVLSKQTLPQQALATTRKHRYPRAPQVPSKLPLDLTDRPGGLSYSHRSVIAGSTRAAPLAGMKAANIARDASPVTAIARTAGSRGWTANR